MGYADECSIFINIQSRIDKEQFDVTLRTVGPYPQKSPKSERALIEFIDRYKESGCSLAEDAGWDNIFYWQNPPKDSKKLELFTKTIQKKPFETFKV